MAYAEIAMFVGQEIMAGIQRKKLAKREAKDLTLTGQNLLQQAVDIETLGGMDELEFREQSGFELASMEAMFADAGAGLTGSVIDVLLASKRRLEIDALKIRETTKRSAKAARGEADQAFLNAERARDAAQHSFFGLF